MRQKLLKEIICRDRCKEDYIEFSSFKFDSNEILVEAIPKMLRTFPPSLGSCVMMSAGFVAVLETFYSLPAMAVIGDLTIYDEPVFKCKSNIPTPKNNETLINQKWDGHCWVEVGGYICDLSIFRTAYKMKGSNLLKDFILKQYGENKGAIASPIEYLPEGISFNPKFVLNEYQLMGAVNGLSM